MKQTQDRNNVSVGCQGLRNSHCDTPFPIHPLPPHIKQHEVLGLLHLLIGIDRHGHVPDGGFPPQRKRETTVLTNTITPSKSGVTTFFYVVLQPDPTFDGAFWKKLLCLSLKIPAPSLPFNEKSNQMHES